VCSHRRSGRLPGRQPGPDPPGTPAPPADAVRRTRRPPPPPPAHRHPGRTAGLPRCRHRPHTPGSKTASAAAKTPNRAASPAARLASTPAGAAPTPADPVELMQVPELPWLYPRRRPGEPVKIAFHDEIAGIHHEWDPPGRKIPTGPRHRPRPTRKTGPCRPRPARLPVTPLPAPFRTPAPTSTSPPRPAAAAAGSRATSTRPLSRSGQPRPDALEAADAPRR
jgi:hypothetical protein